MIVVDGRFLTMQSTGVQRYARELLGRLPTHLDEEIVVAFPPGSLIDAGDHVGLSTIGLQTKWQGPLGHLWEQAVLPELFVRAAGGRRASSGKAVLFSPASWGLVGVNRQLVIIQDIGPQLHPEYFRRSYRALSGVLTPLLVRRCAGIGVSCTTVSTDLQQRYRADPSRIHIVPPGVGAPFKYQPSERSTGWSPKYCSMVGAHDRRKNVSWLLDWWPRLHRELGLELIVTTRGGSSVRFADPLEHTPGVSVRTDRGDTELAGLYKDALCLLWPSLYEGFGLPLLEAMAVGTPFVSTDTSAAIDLAIEQDQGHPLDADRCFAQIRQWHLSGQGTLCDASAYAAATWTWDAAARAAAGALRATMS